MPERWLGVANGASLADTLDKMWITFEIRITSCSGRINTNEAFANSLKVFFLFLLLQLFSLEPNRVQGEQDNQKFFSRDKPFYCLSLEGNSLECSIRLLIMPYFSNYIHRCRMVYTALYCFREVSKEENRKLGSFPFVPPSTLCSPQ